MLEMEEEMHENDKGLMGEEEEERGAYFTARLRVISSIMKRNP